MKGSVRLKSPSRKFNYIEVNQKTDKPEPSYPVYSLARAKSPSI